MLLLVRIYFDSVPLESTRGNSRACLNEQALTSTGYLPRPGHCSKGIPSCPPVRLGRRFKCRERTGCDHHLEKEAEVRRGARGGGLMGRASVEGCLYGRPGFEGIAVEPSSEQTSEESLQGRPFLSHPLVSVSLEEGCRRRGLGRKGFPRSLSCCQHSEGT